MEFNVATDKVLDCQTDSLDRLTIKISKQTVWIARMFRQSDTLFR